MNAIRKSIDNSNEDKSKIIDPRRFFIIALTIAFPIIIQNLISTLVNAADTIMLGYVSQQAMAASSLAGQVQMILFMLYYGLTAGVSVLAAQYWGKRDLDTIEQVMCLGLKLACPVTLLFIAAVELMPGAVMRLFTTDPEIISEGVRYLRIVGLSWLFAGFSQIYVSVQRSVERVILPTLTYVVSLSVNVLLNATFIFGLFGLPRLGLVGVALGTVFARFAEAIICLIHSLFSKCVRLRLKYLLIHSDTLRKDLLKISIPPMINDGVFSLAGLVFSAILGRLGSDVVAANAVAVMGRNIGAMVSRGVSNATTIIIGKSLGENNIPATKVYARRMTRLSSVFGIIGGITIIAIRPLILRIYADKLAATALLYVNIFLLMESYHIWGEAINTCWNCGCFRGGGDAKYGMFVDSLSLWLGVIPLTASAAFVFKLPVAWVYFCLCLDEFIKMPAFFLHYRKFRWMKNITHERSELVSSGKEKG